MTDRHARVAEIFSAAVALPADERAAHVEQTCGEDEDLRREVMRLISADAVTVAFLDAGPTVEDLRTIEPANIGPYVIESFLGEGGMGIVYRARQRDPDRVVALKVLRPGVVSRQAVDRFEHEKRILARLHHPSIAQIFDAGTYEHHGTSHPYFAMELIEGERLTLYARRHNLDLHARCRLIIRCCEAVDYAHQNGIIHRDLKPANILVQYGDEPRILDFGVARVTARSGITAPSLHTETGQMLGTLQYMSPEQLRGSSSDLDARADVYALGVIAYELFACRLPYDLEDCSIGEAVHRVEEQQPVPLEEVLSEARGDLSTIVAKALEKRPDHRYGSAAAFADDLDRFLNDLPVAARPTTTFYRIRKYARRNRLAFITLIAVVVLLAVAVIGTVSGIAEAARERQRLAQLDDFLRLTLNSVTPAGGHEGVATVSDVLTAAERTLDASTIDDPLTRASVETTVGAVHRGLGDFGAAERILEAAVDRSRTEAGEDHATTVDAKVELARVYADQGRAGAAVELMRPSVEVLRVSRGEDDPKTLNATNLLGWSLHLYGQFEEAREIFRETLERRRRVLGPDHADSLLTQTNLVVALLQTGHYEEAGDLAREAASAYVRTLGPTHVKTLYARHVESRAIWAQGDHVTAARLNQQVVADADEVLGPTHVYTLYWRTISASDLRVSGDLEGAEREARLVVDARRQLVGGGPGSLVDALNELATIQRARSRPAEAEATSREAYRIATEMDPPSPRHLWWSRLGIAVALVQQGREEEGREMLARIEADMVAGNATEGELEGLRSVVSSLPLNIE